MEGRVGGYVFFSSFLYLIQKFYCCGIQVSSPHQTLGPLDFIPSTSSIPPSLFTILDRECMAQHTDTSTDARPLKRRRVEVLRHHKLEHVQQLPAHTEPAPQDALFVQGQLLRSITTALAAVGFDSVRPSALEAFRAETEECRSQTPHKPVASYSLFEKICFTS